MFKLLSFLSKNACPVRERYRLNLQRQGQGVSARINLINCLMFSKQHIPLYVTIQLSNLSCLAKMPRQEKQGAGAQFCPDKEQGAGVQLRPEEEIPSHAECLAKMPCQDAFPR